ncbi:VWA domain-containing protein [Aquirufa nivalisilvae]|uniref:VWA domain-containing protein n=1 Tax=Aquirufa nivalisilvae TaxID=2516557 RepID=UPI0022A9502A|nr:VWA domain-containing protein [Aquirufa nivalisilvae]MCZ2479814.1 VWA domain-containing protein [Aquirufa nivalisilvae]
MKYQLYFSWQQFVSLFSYHWEHEAFLFLLPLPLIIFLIRYLLNRKNQARITLSFTKPLVQNRLIRLISFIPDIVQILLLTSIILALAGPYKINPKRKIQPDGIDMALAIDISSSMLNQDVSPSRLVIAKQVATSFVKQRKNDFISIVAFAGAPYLASPITNDSTYLQQALLGLDSKLIKEEGTALGDALGMCINQVRDSPNPKKISILISDGNNTAGNLDPLTSTELAKTFGIKVYTIAVGSLKPSMDPVDESTLRVIAEKSKGKFYRATDQKSLNAIFEEINRMESTKVKEIYWEEHQDQSKFFFDFAFIVFFLGLFLKLSPISNILED